MRAQCCALCRASADPRCSLLTAEGLVYSLCHGCSPEAGEERVVAQRCRATRIPPAEIVGGG